MQTLQNVSRYNEIGQIGLGVTKLEELEEGFRDMIAQWLGYAIPKKYIFVNIIWVSQMRWETVCIGLALCDSCLSAHGQGLG